MEEWKIQLYKLMDESDQPKELDKLAQKLFNYLSVNKIKDLKKFKERMGPEYEKLVEHMNSGLSQDLIRDDDFFNLTIELTRKYTSKTNQSKD